MNAFNSVMMGAVAVAMAAAMTPGDAAAATQFRGLNTNAVGACQGAVPEYEKYLRKRPLAIQNMGTIGVYVSCAFTAQYTYEANSYPVEVYVFAKTYTGVDTTLSCVGVTGDASGHDNQYLTHTITLPADGELNYMLWYAEEFSGSPANFPSPLFSISCNLAPGVALADMHVHFDEDIGS